ncbi:MAG: arginine--tRNA ligase [Oscillospiraceae bacterium]
MHDPIAKAKATLISAIEAAYNTAVAKGVLPNFGLGEYTVEIPADTSHGDFATNAALCAARTLKLPPQKIAAALLDNLDLGSSGFSKAEMAGPGFLNFFLSNDYYSDVVRAVLSQKERFGHTDFGRAEKVMVEFVSANPTGPMHLGNARGGALGDCLASILDAAGFAVTREFYINDAGNQIERFALSLEVRFLQELGGDVALPEDCYQGEDITLLAREYIASCGDGIKDADSAERKKALVDFALPKNIANLKRDLLKYRIEFDIWFKESTLHNDGTVAKVLDMLKSRGAVYENDGALWYKATAYGGDKDEVLVRSNGIPTYFAADIAYHYNKFAVRGFDRVINVWGADHHGHVARLKGAMDAIGLDGSKLDIVLMQLVRLMRDGEPVRMSKRTGKAITLTDLLDEIPIDAARFYFNLREPKTHCEFDLDLAVKQSSENPVYYVQYAHARICSILKALRADSIDVDGCLDNADFSLLCSPDEQALIKHISALPGEIISAATEYDPAKITRYTIDLATLFHKFYTNCRVKGCELSLCTARAALCIATRQVIRNCLELLKIDAPETM